MGKKKSKKRSNDTKQPKNESSKTIEEHNEPIITISSESESFNASNDNVTKNESETVDLSSSHEANSKLDSDNDAFVVEDDENDNTLISPNESNDHSIENVQSPFDSHANTIRNANMESEYEIDSALIVSNKEIESKILFDTEKHASPEKSVASSEFKETSAVNENANVTDSIITREDSTLSIEMPPKEFVPEKKKKSKITEADKSAYLDDSKVDISYSESEPNRKQELKETNEKTAEDQFADLNNINQTESTINKDFDMRLVGNTTEDFEDTKSAPKSIEKNEMDKLEFVDSSNQIFIPPIYKYNRSPDLEKQLKELIKEFAFSLCVVNFEHTKGPEIEYWIDDDIITATMPERDAMIKEKIATHTKFWPHLAFEALPDGAHLYDETFTNFTLSYDAKWSRIIELPVDKMDNYDDPLVNVQKAVENGFQVVELEDPYQTTVTLFGCGCIRQLDISELEKPEEDVKRNIIQKSVILLTREPLPIQLREKLSIVTQSWFEQHSFQDIDILFSLWEHIKLSYNQNGYMLKDDELYEDINITQSKEISTKKVIKESDLYMGLNFQQLVRKLRRNLLTIFKALVLGKSKILFFSKDLNELSNIQYCLIGLVPTLLLYLKDSGFPLLDRIGQNWKKSSSLKSSDRESLLQFLGLPLCVFGLGSFFQPYMTLQQLDYLSNKNTESFVIGASNDIILERKNEWFDIVIYLDEDDSGLFGSGGCKVEFVNKELRDTILLTTEDKKFIDVIIEEVVRHEHANENECDSGIEDGGIQNSLVKKGSKTVNYNPTIENGHYKGGDDFIRLYFEEYLVGMIATIKYDQFLTLHTKQGNTAVFGQLGMTDFENDVNRFNHKFIEEFKTSRVGVIWNKNTEDELFNFFEPKHPGKSQTRSKFAQGVLSQLFAKKSPLETEENQEKGNVEFPVLKEDENTAKVGFKTHLSTIGKSFGDFFKRRQVDEDESLLHNVENVDTESTKGQVLDTGKVTLEQKPSPSDADAGSEGKKLRGLFGW